MPANPADLVAKKAALRRNMRARLDAHTAHLQASNPAGWRARLEQWGNTQRLRWRLHALLVPMGRQVVAAYHPMRGEMDLIPLLTKLHARGWQTALPRIAADPHDKRMQFCAWNHPDPLAANRFGIQEPAFCQPLNPGVILIPLVAFDAQGGRLGYGKGYYDTTLAACVASRAAPPLLIGVGYDFQRVDRVPAEPHDMPLDWIVTPGGILRAAFPVTQS